MRKNQKKYIPNEIKIFLVEIEKNNNEIKINECYLLFRKKV